MTATGPPADSPAPETRVAARIESSTAWAWDFPAMYVWSPGVPSPS